MTDHQAVAWSEAWATVEKLALGNPARVVHQPLQAIAEALCDLRRHIETLSDRSPE